MTDDKLKPRPVPWCEGGYALDVIKRGDCFANGYLVAMAAYVFLAVVL